MKKVKLPLTVDPIKSAQRRLNYEGYYSQAQLVRLKDAVNQVLNNVEAELTFAIDPQKLVVMQGKATVDVMLECQRCGTPFPYHLSCTFNYSPVSNMDQADVLPEIYEPIELNDFGEIDLLGVIEDELLLSLPLVPMHEPEHCEVSEDEQVFGELPEELAKKPNPFAVLASLKKQK